MVRPITVVAALAALMTCPALGTPVVPKRDVGLPSTSTTSPEGIQVPGLGEVTDVLRDVPDDAIEMSLATLRDIKERIKTLSDPPRHVAAK